MIWSIAAAFQARRHLILENLALRQQLAVLNRNAKKPNCVKLTGLFWIGLLAFWDRWRYALVILQPQTVVGWHRAGFRLYWRWKSRREGRPRGV